MDDIKISVLDDDVTSADHVGSITMKVSSLAYNNGVRDWVRKEFLMMV